MTFSGEPGSGYNPSPLKSLHPRMYKIVIEVRCERGKSVSTPTMPSRDRIRPGRLGRGNKNPGRLGKGNKKRMMGNGRRVTWGNHLYTMFETNVDFGGPLLCL